MKPTSDKKFKYLPLLIAPILAFILYKSLRRSQETSKILETPNKPKNKALTKQVSKPPKNRRSSKVRISRHKLPTGFTQSPIDIITSKVVEVINVSEEEDSDFSIVTDSDFESEEEEKVEKHHHKKGHKIDDDHIYFKILYPLHKPLYNATIVNTTHTIQVNNNPDKDTENEFKIIFNNKEYELIQFHFHTPSEHTIDSVRYDMEMHLVHKNKKDGTLAVIGIIYHNKMNNKKADIFLDEFINGLPSTTNANHPVKLNGPITFNELFHYNGENKDIFEYIGSLTTPPYTEGVLWIIIKNVKNMSVKQLDIFHEKMGNIENARPVQRLYRRKISSARLLLEDN